MDDDALAAWLESTGPATCGMIWWLASHRARLRFATSAPTRAQVLDVIRSAHENYRDGLTLAIGS